MFKAQLKSETLKGLVNMISTLIDEVKFTVSPEGLSLKAVDPAHVAMVELMVESGAFESYEADETELGIDLDKVKDVLKLASSGDIISMEQDADHGRLIFKIGNITRRMSLVDTSSMNDVKVPQLKLSSTVKASESISDHISLIAEGETFELLCEGDTDSANLTLDSSSLESINAPSRVSSMFPLDYFSNFIKAIPSDVVVEIELDTDYPVIINFDLAGDNGKVKYLLAPRIESD